MSTTQLQQIAPGRYRVSGELTFASVSGLLDESRKHLSAADGLVLDLAGVERADSAGLALLLHWLREARGGGKSLDFQNVPEQLQALARLSNLDGLLPGVPAE